MSKQNAKRCENVFEKKRIRELAEDDYVSPAQSKDISESDIHRPFGATKRDSDAESSEAKALRSWARRQYENDEVLRKNLSKLPGQVVRDSAELIGVEGIMKKSKVQLIEEIVKAMHLGE